MSDNSKGKNLPFFRFQGTHSEMGLQQGKALSELINGTRNLLKTAEEIELMKPKFMSKDIFLLLGEAVAWLQYAPPVGKHHPEQYSRFNAIARGASVRPSFLALLNSMEVEFDKIHYVMPAAGCSAAGVQPSKTKDNKPYVIKNFDYPEKFLNLQFIRLDKPKGRYQVLSVTAAPLAGTHDGINEHGLTITYNYGFPHGKSKSLIPISLIVQDALETCKTTQEAVDFIIPRPRAGGAILTVCDASGDLRTIELSNQFSGTVKAARGFIANTNHFHEEKMKTIDVPPGSVYDSTSPATLRNLSCRFSTEARCNRIEELLNENTLVDKDGLIKILSDHGADNSPSDNTVCRHSPYYTTIITTLFSPANPSMLVTFNNPCKGGFVEFTFD